ncbi:MAG: hemolysin family protein [Planctomycetota bacterium]
MDPTYCWWAVALAAGATAFLSLALGALRYYSLARFEDLLEGQPGRLERVKAFLAEEELHILTVTVLRGLAILGGMVALTGGLIARTLAGAEGAPVELGEWLLTGLEALGIGAVLFIALGRVVPHALGEGRAEPVLLRLGPILSAAARVARPLTWLFGGLAQVALRVFDVQQPGVEEEAKDDILSAALAGEKEGVIDEDTMDVIENLMVLGDVAVSEVMTPRTSIVSVDIEMGLQAMLDVALEHERSRLPVTEGGLDKIVGVLMVKDLLRAWKDPALRPAELMRKAFFVPETKPVKDLLKELRERKTHIAIVADEYGGTAGLVTIEDLIEEIIGEIDDEHDKEEAVPPVRRLSDSLVDADATFHIDEFNEEFGTKIPEDEDVETLGGFIALRLGRIPSRGDRVELNGTALEVTAADERRVQRVLVKLG